MSWTILDLSKYSLEPTNDNDNVIVSIFAYECVARLNHLGPVALKLASESILYRKSYSSFYCEMKCVQSVNSKNGN